MEKKPFITLEQARDIIKDIPTPFHLYDEKGIRENARELYKAFSWNKRLLPIPILCKSSKRKAVVWTARPTPNYSSARRAEFPAVILCSAQT